MYGKCKEIFHSAESRAPPSQQAETRPTGRTPGDRVRRPEAPAGVEPGIRELQSLGSPFESVQSVQTRLATRLLPSRCQGPGVHWRPRISGGSCPRIAHALQRGGVGVTGPTSPPGAASRNLIRTVTSHVWGPRTDRTPYRRTARTCRPIDGSLAVALGDALRRRGAVSVGVGPGAGLGPRRLAAGDRLEGADGVVPPDHGGPHLLLGARLSEVAPLSQNPPKSAHMSAIWLASARGDLPEEACNGGYYGSEEDQAGDNHGDQEGASAAE